MSHPPHSTFSRARKLTVRCTAIALAASAWGVTTSASAAPDTTTTTQNNSGSAGKNARTASCQVAFVVRLGQGRQAVRKTMNRKIKLQRNRNCAVQRKTKRVANRALGKPCRASVIVNPADKKKVTRQRTVKQRQKVMRQHGVCQRHKAKQRRANLPKRAMKVARAQVGDPYRYGATGPHAFDCSGLTSFSYARAGKSIPRTTGAQRAATRHISRKDARVGDLVFFHSGSGVYHVGLYAGGNNVLHSPRTGQHVRTERIWTSSVSFGRV